MRRKVITAFLVTSVLVFSGCSQTNTGGSTGAVSENSEESSIDTSDMFTERDLETAYDEENSTVIHLSDEETTADSDGVQISGSTVTITEAGTYLLSGKLSDGMVIVEAGDSDKVQLVLDGADITSSASAAIYVRSGDKVFLTTAEGSENSLTNGGTYTNIDENNIDSVIFSKSDLTLNGSGTLKITAHAGHGIVSKDDLVLTGGTYEIQAAEHGISGKDSVRIAGGTYTIMSGEDGIHAKNTDDTSKGFVYIENGSFHITAGDDGIHADSSVFIAGGTIEIAESYEGIEGLSIDITGGDIDLTASDDGLNAAGGNDSSGTEGPGGGDQFASVEGAYIEISGGTLHVNASGDGIDSNGDLTVSGGETYVSGPTDSGNGALDYNGTATISGGILVAAGSSGMAQNFGESSTQGVMMVTVDTQSAGSEIALLDSQEQTLVSWNADKEYTMVVVSCPELTEGQTYTLTTGTKSQQITMDSLVYGGSREMGGPSGGSGPTGRDRRR